MELLHAVFWCLLARNQPLTLIDLLPLVENTENLVFFVVYCVFSHDLGMKMAPSFLSITLQENGANIQMVSRFCLAPYNRRLLDSHFPLVYFSGLRIV